MNLALENRSKATQSGDSLSAAGRLFTGFDRRKNTASFLTAILYLPIYDFPYAYKGKPGRIQGADGTVGVT